MRTTAIAARGTLCLLAVLAAGAGIGACSRPVVVRAADGLAGAGAPGTLVPSVVVVVSAGLLAAAWAWLLVCVAACLLDCVTGAGPAGCSLLRPRLVRVLVGVAVGVAVGTSGPVLAAERDPAPSLAGLPLPERLPDAPSPGDHHLVRTGDTLWAIAEQRLPAGAPAASVAAGWRAIHRANLRRIGPDPDLIRPGTVLHLPAPTPTPTPGDRP
jgi:hypothetical protein